MSIKEQQRRAKIAQAKRENNPNSVRHLLKDSDYLELVSEARQNAERFKREGVKGFRESRSRRFSYEPDDDEEQQAAHPTCGCAVNLSL